MNEETFHKEVSPGMKYGTKGFVCSPYKEEWGKSITRQKNHEKITRKQAQAIQYVSHHC